ncbi:MAG: acyl-CoA dehydrogenase family protein [Alphaproteobacteria bacterium]|nr:acyl-CoA dehydrogenase family protein [Deltaproteobacteria bacterium]MCB9690205.1 acyl-CoA dehydrogenase family protein [Alphaproteobacteria bacterium]
MVATEVDVPGEGVPKELDGDELSEIRLAVRRFVRERLIPHEAQVEDEDEVPEALVEEMKALGLFGLSIPESYGGLGLGLEEQVGVYEELGYTSPAFRSVFGTNVGIGSLGILLDGTESQRQAYLPRLATGELVGSFALTEPDVGSDAAAVRTRAREDGDSYVLDGTKRYITNAARAGVFTVMARTGSPASRGDGVTAFAVDAHLPGIEIGAPERKMGQRGAKVCDVIFDGVRVPKSSIIGGVPGQGFKTAMKTLDVGRLHVAALCVGAMQRALDEAARFAQTREQFGRPIAEFQLIQAMLADSSTELLAAKTMVRATAARFDRGKAPSADASRCKLFATEALGRVADRAVQIHGGAGYIADYAVERIYRDARLFRLYEGTSQIQQLIIARDVLSPG